MSNGKPSLPFEGPTAEDCRRLLATIHEEFNPGCWLEFSFWNERQDQSGFKLEVLDWCPISDLGAPIVHVWATKTFGPKNGSISLKSVYDLLLTSYREMEKFFKEPDAPGPAHRTMENYLHFRGQVLGYLDSGSVNS